MKENKKKQERKHREVYLVLLLLLFISVGFAVLTATLNITGNTTVHGNKWEVKFGTPVETTAVGGKGEVTRGGDTDVSFTANLDQPGEYYEFEVPVTNNGTIDVKISEIADVTLTSDQKTYMTHSVKWKTNSETVAQNDAIKAGETCTLVVRVEYRSDLDTDALAKVQGDTPVASTYGLTFIQADSSAKYITKDVQ